MDEAEEKQLERIAEDETSSSDRTANRNGINAHNTDDKETDSSTKEHSGDFGEAIKRSDFLGQAQRSIRNFNTMLSERKLTSLHLRKLPVNVLLRPHTESQTVIVEEISNQELSAKFETEEKDFVHYLCLRPSYTIKKQLMLAFGTINAATTCSVVLVCIITAVLAGQSIKDSNCDSFESLERESQVRTAEYVARSLSLRLIPEDELNTLRALTVDRFSGYPEPTDLGVPFLDMESSERLYPIVGEPLPLDWQLTPNVNERSYEEHFQNRLFWRGHLEIVSTLTAGFAMQGSCDPKASERNDPRYWPSCTGANNDITIGGVVTRSNTTKLIYRKSSDLVPAMKALFESREEIRDIGIYFANDGAGASTTYPQIVVNGTSTYISEGCDWMSTTSPVKPSEPIGTKVMIEKCKPVGEVVSVRAYNAMETSWCAKQALGPDELVIDTVLDDINDSKSWLMRIGRAIYDRLTQNFIGCSYIGVSLLEIEPRLQESRFTPSSEVSIVSFDPLGAVIASSVPGLASRNIPVFDADLGLDSTSFDELFTLISFDTEWNPSSVASAYRSFQAGDQGFLVSAYPVPPIPDEYDPTYRPLSFVISSTSIDEIFQVLNETNDEVDESVKEVILLCILVGAIGVAVTTVVIFAMSNFLTSPLRSMNDAANDIVDSFGDPSKDTQIACLSAEKTVEARCSPKTELDEVAKEFNDMVASFSGKMMATSQKGRHPEVPNDASPIRADFKLLYQSRAGSKYDIALGPFEERSKNSADEFRYVGSNLAIAALDEAVSVDGSASKQKRGCSPLLLWIIGLIVTPLLLSNITITAVVLRKVSKEFSESVDKAKLDFLEVQKRTLLVQSRLRADTVSSIISRPTRDAYVITRYASWLLFGGLAKADIFLDVTSGVEQCKAAENGFLECPYTEDTYVCDCLWDTSGNTGTLGCSKFPNGSRDLQVLSWACESQPVKENGDRPSSMFPNASYSPETTQWWDDPFILPGIEEYSNTSGFESTHSRLRSISALPVLQQLYDNNPGKGLITSFVAFEADGLLVGYSGCNNVAHANYAHYSVRQEDTATRPELCPAGKYGYDPRCRGWYDVGRKLAVQNQTYLYVTAPYSFATTDLFFAQSATMALVDPRTGEHVGQVLIDFLADPLNTELDDHTYLSDSGFPFVIATQSDHRADTVLAPGFQRNETARPISRQVLPFDFDCDKAPCLQNLEDFKGTVEAMRRGESSIVEFRRFDSESNAEVVHMAFAPVKVKSFWPIDSSVFSRGVNVSEYLIYALALAEPEAAILEPFDPVESTTRRLTRVAFAVLSILITAATLVVLLTSYNVARSISEPLLYVSDLIHSINKNDAKKASSGVKRINSSHEAAVLSETMEMLYTCLRSANGAFYSGDLLLAYSILVDALRLFKRLENKKAIGIANNNLGNVLFAMHLKMKSDTVVRLGPVSRMTAVKNGIFYYGEAIRLGETAYDEFYNRHGWSPICLEFMQHLANRYFNRGLFLLTVKDDHKNPTELEQLGRRDLRIARDMDEEIISYGEEIGWASSDRMAKIFKNIVLRVRGYNLLLQQGYDDAWETETLLDEAFDILQTEVKKESSPLFDTMALQGRLQDLESELIKYRLSVGDVTAAAQIAIRMMFEDEFTFIDASSQAVEALFQYASASLKEDQSRITLALKEMRLELEEASEDQCSKSFAELNSSVVARSSVLSRGSTSSNFQSRYSTSTEWYTKQDGGRFVIMEDF